MDCSYNYVPVTTWSERGYTFWDRREKKNVLGCLHFFKPITIVLGEALDAETVALQNGLGKELVLVEHLHPAKENATYNIKVICSHNTVM